MADAFFEHIPNTLVPPDAVSEAPTREGLRVLPPRTGTSLKRVGLLVGASDAVVLSGGAIVAGSIRPRPVPLAPGVLAALVGIAIAVFASFGVYAVSRWSPADELRRIVNSAMVTLGAWLLGFAVVSRGPVRVHWLAGWWASGSSLS